MRDEDVIELRMARAIQDKARLYDCDPGDKLEMWAVESARAAIAEINTSHVLVSKVALRWLFGEGADFYGKWFGDCEPVLVGKFPRKYWWRSAFREMIWPSDYHGITEAKENSVNKG